MMSPDERRLLEETIELTRENSRILHGMQRAQRWSQLFGVIKWVIVVGATLGAYYFLQPYLDQLLSVYGSALGGLDQLKNAGQNLFQQ